jgi:predicted alpha/beta-fold hydrolase
MREFAPPWWLLGGHRMTVFVWARDRQFPDLPTAEPRLFDVDAGTRVLAHCHWQPSPQNHPTIVTLHGLEGSSGSHYMLGIADKALGRGFNVVRLNQRNCGGTEHLTDGLYHSGLTGDVMAVLTELATIDRLPAIAVSGYSLGGNLALRMAGLCGANPPSWLRAVSAVSPSIELGSCITAIERRRNRLYERDFMKGLRVRIRAKARLFPERYDASDIDRVRGIRAFDDRYTAPHHGFTDAADYYYRAASMRVIDQIGIPTLIITAEDDPFIPVEPFRDPKVTGNPHIDLRVTRHGGHCGYYETPRNGYDGYWAEQQIVEFFDTHLRN